MDAETGAAEAAVRRAFARARRGGWRGDRQVQTKMCGQCRQACGKALADGAEFPVSLTPIQLGQNHRGFAACARRQWKQQPGRARSIAEPGANAVEYAKGGAGRASRPHRQQQSDTGNIRWHRVQVDAEFARWCNEQHRAIAGTGLLGADQIGQIARLAAAVQQQRTNLRAAGEVVMRLTDDADSNLMIVNRAIMPRLQFLHGAYSCSKPSCRCEWQQLGEIVNRRELAAWLGWLGGIRAQHR